MLSSDYIWQRSWNMCLICSSTPNLNSSADILSAPTKRFGTEPLDLSQVLESNGRCSTCLIMVRSSSRNGNLSIERIFQKLSEKLSIIWLKFGDLFVSKDSIISGISFYWWIKFSCDNRDRSEPKSLRKIFHHWVYALSTWVNMVRNRSINSNIDHTSKKHPLNGLKRKNYQLF